MQRAIRRHLWMPIHTKSKVFLSDGASFGQRGAEAKQMTNDE
jgi:hypothetical protein